VVSRAVRVAVDSVARALQPGDGGRAVHVGIHRTGLLARFALGADAARLGAARCASLGQEAALPQALRACTRKRW
jgi:hypothetical protein